MKNISLAEHLRIMNWKLNKLQEESMIECTLQEAIKRCKENGGSFYKKDNSAHFMIMKNNRAFYNVEKNKEYHFSPHDVLSTWIYEPPKESAFQKWHASEGNDNYDTFEMCSKNGWNAAIDIIIKAQILCPTGTLLAVDELLDKIKELKEP